MQNLIRQFCLPAVVSAAMLACMSVAEAQTCEQLFSEANGAHFVAGSRDVVVRLDNLSISGTLERSIPFLRPRTESESEPIQRLLTLIPSDNIGRAMLYTFPDGARYSGGGYARPTIYWFSLKRPKFAAQHGIGAGDSHSARLLLLPNADRLNFFFSPLLVERAKSEGLEAPELRFEDLSIFRPQQYSGRYFFDRFAKGFISLASRGEYEKHDRAQEHLLGALFTPIATLNAFVNYVRFIEAVEQIEPIRKNKQLRKTLSSEVDAVAAYWDLVTSSIGDAVNIITEFDNFRSYREEATTRVTGIVFDTHRALSSEKVRLGPLMNAIESSDKLSPGDKVKLVNQIAQLRARYLTTASEVEVSRFVSRELNRAFRAD